MEGSGITTGEALLLNDRNRDYDGFGGGYWFWLIIILFFFGWGNRDGATQDGVATRAAVNEGFQYNQLDNGIRAIQNGICQSTYELSTAIKDCCCTTNRNLDSVRYDMSRGFCDTITAMNLNTRDILEKQTEGVQKILDYMCNNEKQALRQEVQALQLNASLQAQTASLINQIRPTPIPAYITCSPYTTAYYGYNNYGCGCGCGV